MTTEEAIKLQNDIDAGPGTWSEKWEKKDCIREWSEKLFREACKSKGLITNQQIHRFVLDNDMNCTKVDVMISGIVRDDEEFKITAWIDYDVEIIWAKFGITHKPTNTRFKNAIGLGRC